MAVNHTTVSCLFSWRAAGFLEYLDSSGRYKTELLRAKYEYEQAWNPEWEPNKEDALSVSVCSSSPGDGLS